MFGTIAVSVSELDKKRFVIKDVHSEEEIYKKMCM